MSARAGLEVVEPAGGRRESLLVCAAMVGILLTAGVAIEARLVERSEPRLLDWQISAFADLSPVDQAIYNALAASAEELWLMHGDLLYFGTEEQRANPWPTVDQLDSDQLLPPFHRDLSWSQQGAVDWQRVASFSFEGSTVYFGSGGKLEGQSAYLLSLSHTHKGATFADGATVWVHSDSNVAAPDNVKRDSLILNGWKEVVPYSGAMEVERLKGGGL